MRWVNPEDLRQCYHRDNTNAYFHGKEIKEQVDCWIEIQGKFLRINGISIWFRSRIIYINIF